MEKWKSLFTFKKVAKKGGPTWKRRTRFSIMLGIMHIRLILIVISCIVTPIVLVPMSATQRAPTTVSSGIYTIEQAERGEQIYKQQCSLCHRDNLLGNTVDGGPPLRGPQFTTRWEGLSIETMLGTVEELMPMSTPGSLSRQEYVDVVSFILWANELPAGETELPTSADALQQIVMTFEP